MDDLFRVALSGDFRRADGTPTFPHFDVGPLLEAPGIATSFLDPADPLRPDQLEQVDAVILLAHRFDASSVPASGRLAIVARFGVGYDTVDVEACTRAGIALVITPEGVRRPVAVSIIALMLALTGKLMVKDRLARQAGPGFAQRSAHMGVGLVGRTLGSLGVGNIGAELFRLARPFDMRFIAHDPFADPDLARDLDVELVGLDDLFREADVLSVCCPLTPRTRHVVDANRIGMMKSSAYLINTARGAIVDQRALTDALQTGRIAGAGLDVLEREPPDPDDPILSLDNVILSPHALCWTDQCFAGNGAADIRAVIDVQHGRVPQGVVNRDVLEDPRWRRRLAEFADRFGP